jgi:hypothetical protein
MGWVQRHAPAALPRERFGTHCIGGWVGPRAKLEMCGKSLLHRDSISGSSIRVASRYIDCAIPVHLCTGKSKVHLCTGTEALYRPYGP